MTTPIHVYEQAVMVKRTKVCHLKNPPKQKQKSSPIKNCLFCHAPKICLTFTVSRSKKKKEIIMHSLLPVYTAKKKEPQGKATGIGSKKQVEKTKKRRVNLSHPPRRPQLQLPQQLVPGSRREMPVLDLAAAEAWLAARKHWRPGTRPVAAQNERGKKD